MWQKCLNFLMRATGKDLTLEVDMEDKWSPINYTSISWGHKDKCSDSSEHIKLPSEALLATDLVWRRCFKTLGRSIKHSISFTRGDQTEKIFLKILICWKTKNSGKMLSSSTTWPTLKKKSTTWSDSSGKTQELCVSHLKTKLWYIWVCRNIQKYRKRELWDFSISFLQREDGEEKWRIPTAHSSQWVLRSEPQIGNIWKEIWASAHKICCALQYEYSWPSHMSPVLSKG